MSDRDHLGIQWIGFDLDDTLYFYRKASGQVAEAVFENLSDEIGCDFGVLKNRYADILRKAQSGGFAEGKTSRVLRGERFSALMAGFSILTISSVAFLRLMMTRWRATWSSRKARWACFAS